jgi:hypothetical protein
MTHRKPRVGTLLSDHVLARHGHDSWVLRVLRCAKRFVFLRKTLGRTTPARSARCPQGIGDCDVRLRWRATVSTGCVLHAKSALRFAFLHAKHPGACRATPRRGVSMSKFLVADWQGGSKMLLNAILGHVCAGGGRSGRRCDMRRLCALSRYNTALQIYCITITESSQYKKEHIFDIFFSDAKVGEQL